MKSPWSRLPKAFCFSALSALFLLLGVAPAEPVRVRIVAANLTSGDNQSYDPGHGIRILQALKPDVVLIQEFRYQKGPLRQLVNQVAGSTSQFYCEGGEGIPNGVISRWPIKQSGSWADPNVGNRDFAYAVIDLPGDKDLWAVSVHLLAGSEDVERRNDQAERLVSLIKKNVPKGQYLALGGDFNTQVRGELCVGTLGEVVVNYGPYPTDQSGDGDTSANRNKPYDWVLANDELHARMVPVPIAGRAFPGGLVFDSRVFSPIASAAPAERGDSGAQNMQHMAVIRDFVLP